jgi:hypothetical protein
VIILIILVLDWLIMLVFCFGFWFWNYAEMDYDIREDACHTVCVSIYDLSGTYV